jgi:hypothetical protein
VRRIDGQRRHQLIHFEAAQNGMPWRNFRVIPLIAPPGKTANKGEITMKKTFSIAAFSLPLLFAVGAEAQTIPWQQMTSYNSGPYQQPRLTSDKLGTWLTIGVTGSGNSNFPIVAENAPNNNDSAGNVSFEFLPDEAVGSSVVSGQAPSIAVMNFTCLDPFQSYGSEGYVCTGTFEDVVEAHEGTTAGTLMFTLGLCGGPSTRAAPPTARWCGRRSLNT